MRIVATCGACQAQFKVEDTHAGKKLKCTKCGGPVIVPGLAAAPPANVSTTPKPVAVKPETPVAKAAVPVKPVVPKAPPPPPPVEDDTPFLSETPPPVEEPVAAAAYEPEPEPEAGGDDGEWSFLSGATPAAAPASVPQTAPAPTTIPARHDSSRYVPKKKSNPLPWIIGGAVALVLISGGVVFMMMRGGDKKSPVAQTPAKTGPESTADAKLIVPLPDGAERGKITISFDGRGVSVPFTGDYVATAPPGRYALLIQRVGYQAVSERIQLKGGEEKRFDPKWEALPSAPAPATIVGSSDDNPTGFEGWYQNPDEALKKAAAEKKDVVVALIGSDWSEDSKEMTQEVFAAEEFKRRLGKQYIFCVLDFPKKQNRNKVKDRNRNEIWREKLHVEIEDVPVVAILDSAGQMFGITKFVARRFSRFLDEEEEEQKITTEDLVRRLNDFQDNRKEIRKHLDSIAAAQGADKLRQLRTALDWVIQKRVQLAYETQIKDWYKECQRLDPQNGQGQLEVFFEHWWLSRLSQLTAGNTAAMKAVVTEIDEFEKQATFKDQDRGAKMHLYAASAYAYMKNAKDAGRHLILAKKFNPTNPRLAEALRRVDPAEIDVIGSGTGYCVAVGGYLMTNHHVVEHGTPYIRIPGQTEPVRATVLATEKKIDMALLRVDGITAASLKPLPVVADPVKLGMPIAALGFPLGSKIGTGVKFTRGVISAAPEEANKGLILIDAIVNPGNSGGPMCDGRGAVIGMITAKTRTSGDVDTSYGMAIPGDTVLKFIKQHVTDFTPITPPKQPLSKDSQDWSDVATQVSPSVFMILMKE